ncbi:MULTISPECIES: 2,3,4,5-tetrahydropyridine-2,6-dicarboxylate N-succinyltransferase [unclassified Colwellia]|jgi:2,3,4,5-tetrahydropyridine-2-carboxylate N-succinyltransferase|uniref:2,3,4,5-tetrahydropyridine-2,6-dicarboxylate N-succinyltransferase n=1 Tax=unclassified Colwellia TaxID=196834 RepID=UPI0015F66885|nr:MULTISPECIES: 2,3,4,5-tetrahydropyridine-2,6-dicarboxylate N-succinyltransferase [unclassified Colwellia]MBA6348513.1 2,3,4,5-tetrahydropyridine-2,6-dicarboxylate N-succinyltransferase [Colwellia sp. BRX8-9]MBA6352359.1 2,3,4,5-tetrahydropyridine-2,6-dicarboxylate N-succinyltransferase [Colwellia sp. BRX9-1]MBA6356027.1 2,3,4,5-tetrahydropyridine-2,6-dicarboxylate N-succinyltransferase [Colwellia sp. BRX8-3]MBA6359689.1 2,3,4,5-tetrahydropyridine-2,6-dicarboxylate N-succinyltransferase [Colw|tara:strand:- start:4725 stop:5474 length:750 start_codon:yes stop_codon:yes gene_type:complete
MNWQETLTQLEAGTVRAANQDEAGNWQANVAVKEAILSAFKAGENIAFDGIYKGFVDKHNLPAREFTADDKVRLVPGGSSVRRGAHVAPGVIIMPPAYINVGAFVDTGTMIDSHALIGSCAQIGKNVHVSAAVQIGGVLEPVGASPVIIEDGAFLSAGVVIVEGIVVKKGAVLAPGVSLSASVPVYDCVNEVMLEKGADIPERAVVVPGTRPVSGAWAKTHGLNMACALIVKYRDEKSNASLELESILR